MTRYLPITDPDGNAIDVFSRPFHHVYIEKLDGRTPMHKYYRYRFMIRGDNLIYKFNKWMTESFGPYMGYDMAKHQMRCGVTLERVKWVFHRDEKEVDKANIYFNQDCEPLIFLKFK